MEANKVASSSVASNGSTNGGSVAKVVSGSNANMDSGSIIESTPNLNVGVGIIGNISSNPPNA